MTLTFLLLAAPAPFPKPERVPPTPRPVGSWRNACGESLSLRRDGTLAGTVLGYHSAGCRDVAGSWREVSPGELELEFRTDSTGPHQARLRLTARDGVPVLVWPWCGTDYDFHREGK